LSKLEHPEKIDVSETSKDENPSFKLNNVEVRMHDLESLAPGKMVNDVMATVLLKYVYAWRTRLFCKILQVIIYIYIYLFFSEQLCQFPVVDCLFNSILRGGKGGNFKASPKMCKLNVKFLKIHFFYSEKQG